VYTDHAIFDIDSTGEGHVRVLETFGISVPALGERMRVELG
jgi:3-oxoadipate CoA-transferase, beta subunit